MIQLSRLDKFQDQSHINLQKRDMNVKEVQQVMQILSETLQKELRRDVFKTYMKNLQFLEQTFSQECLENLYESIEENMYSPQEVIISEDDEQIGQQNEDICLYLIVKGNVCITQNSKIIRTLKQNDYFGEIQFLCGQRCRLGAKSVDYSTILTIKRSDLINTIYKSCEKDKQQFKHLMDIINFALHYNIINHQCLICGEANHLTSNCGKVHLEIDRLELVKNDNLLQVQHRSSFDRFQLQKFPTLKNALEVENKVCEFISNQMEVVEDYEFLNNLVDNEEVQNEYWQEYQKEQDEFQKNYQINANQISHYSSQPSSKEQFLNSSYM